MMLLSAVVLIIAFLALSAMVSRIAQLASVTTQEQDRPIILEVPVVRQAIDDVLTDLNAVRPALTASSSPTKDVAIEASLRHLANLEAARGLRLEFGYDPAETTCAPTPCVTDSDGDGVPDLCEATPTTQGCDSSLGYNGDVECDDVRVWIRLSDGEVSVEVPSRVTFTCT